MKKVFSFFITLLFIYTVQAQNVGIGTTTPASSAKLDVNSTTQGFLPPRLTIEQRNSILSPVAGLIVWCSTCGFSGELQVYNGAVWTTLTGGTASAIIPSDTICSQIWMSKNLDVVTYRNGDSIPQITDNTSWASLTSGAWCYYNNDPANGNVYGKLYNWYAVNDPRGLAPAGWHIPNNTEWEALKTCIVEDGGALKEAGTVHWLSPNTGATNSSGFTALPGGLRSESGFWGYIGQYNRIWSATPFNATQAGMVSLYYLDAGFFIYTADPVREGKSVRCLRN